MVACVFEDTKGKKKGLSFKMNDDRISDAKLKMHMNRRKNKTKQNNNNKTTPPPPLHTLPERKKERKKERQTKNNHECSISDEVNLQLFFVGVFLPAWM